MDCTDERNSGTEECHDKKALRREMKSVLASLGEKDRADLSRAACDRLAVSDLFLSADIVLSYMASGTEADPSRIASAALAACKPLAFPVCAVEGNEMDFFFVRGAGDLDSCLPQFSRNRYGILEPDPVPSAKLTFPLDRGTGILAVIPGLAFSLRGGRLGHGAGYYDRYLAALKRNVRENGCSLTLVGLCFDCQITGAVPLEEHDVPMDYLLTPSALVPCSQNMI